MHPRAADLIEMLGLSPHPEGGWYREVYRSNDAVARDGVQRQALTSIYYMLEAGQVSRWHVVALDEVWHFYEGDPLALITWEPGSALAEVTTLGPPSGSGPPSGRGGRPLAAVPRGVWQAARPLGAYALVGCTVAPGFDFADFAFANDLPEADDAFAGPLAPHEDLR